MVHLLFSRSGFRTTANDIAEPHGRKRRSMFPNTAPFVLAVSAELGGYTVSAKRSVGCILIGQQAVEHRRPSLNSPNIVSVDCIGLTESWNGVY